MNSNFKVLNNSYKTINYINKLIPNFPKKEVVLRNNIEKTCYLIVENIFSYNINESGRLKDKNIKDLLINLSMIDFYIRISYDKKIISKHQFEVVARFITEIKKMVYGLKKREVSDE